MFLNYTSGTTGDPKGVKTTHWGMLTSGFIFASQYGITAEDVFIDYLPAPHAFDQFLVTTCIILGCKMGYFQGNPLKLFEDCQVL